MLHMKTTTFGIHTGIVGWEILKVRWLIFFKTVVYKHAGFWWLCPESREVGWRVTSNYLHPED